MKKLTLIFLALNFFALFLGSQFTSAGVSSDWYTNLNKAPWTPPGWFFGVAWTTIMICYAVFMAKWYEQTDSKQLILGLYIAQWILNVSWNPIFFTNRLVILGLVTITALTILMIYQYVSSRSAIKSYAALVLPYCIWLVIATSLNAYILMYN